MLAVITHRTWQQELMFNNVRLQQQGVGMPSTAHMSSSRKTLLLRC
jgi:hypothetical protein